ncbi:RNase H domain-containing protein [Trichonephila clavipes]|nr:RNase H domain-containing protein [Trichonephila clavipes]
MPPVCTHQWIPVYVDIERNTMADFFANEARTLEPATSSTTVYDANSVAKQKLCSNSRKTFSLSELNYCRETPATIIRQRTKHFKGMEIFPRVQYNMWNAGTTQVRNWIPSTFLAVLPLLVPILK